MKALIPSRHLQDMIHITQAREVWENSKLIKNKSEEVIFKGAMFDVSLSEKRLFTDNGLNLTDEVKKIYCFIKILLGDNIVVDGNKYEVIASENYGIHDELRIYQVKRVVEYE